MQVAPQTPLQKATALVNKVLKDVNECRTHGMSYINMFHMCGIQLVGCLLDPNFLTLHLPAHLHSLRNGAFKLKPIKMSADLISQLHAIAVKLEGCATTLQDLIAKKKNKTKHYMTVIAEASKSGPNSIIST